MKQDPLKQFEQFELKADFYAPIEVVVEGQTADYAWYQKKMIEKRMSHLMGTVMHTIDTIQARSDERLGVIDKLMRENKSLRDKLKEQIK
jgi:hypothetical protein